MVSIFVVSVSISIFSPNAQANPAIMITNYELSPEILMPGDAGLLTLHITNGETVATQTSTSVSGEETTTVVHTLGATINAIDILPAVSGGRQIRAAAGYDNVGYLAAGANMEVSFKLLVDTNMSQGIYFPIVDIDVDGGTDVQYPLMMKVSNSSVNLLPTSVPSKISHGGTTELTITMVNMRENAISEALITPRGENVEFVPQSYFMGSLAAKTSEDVVFSVKPIGTGESILTFNINYKNGDNLHLNSLNVPVTIIEALDVAPIITNFPLSITKGGSSQISIEVYNAKSEKITGVLVTPISTATVIPSQYFIGSMDPDDVFSASFTIYTDTVGFGTQNIGFKVSYNQGNDYYETPLVSKSFDVISGKGVSYQGSGVTNTPSSNSNGFTQSSSLLMCLTPLIILVVALVVAVILYIRWKKRRKA